MIDTRRRVQKTKGPCAVLTIVNDDVAFQRIWLSYYIRYFAARDIYVIHHRITGEERIDWPAERNVFAVEHPYAADGKWSIRTVSRVQWRLLRRYQRVLFCEIDELIVADPRTYPLGLRQYLEAGRRGLVKAEGYEVLQMPGERDVLADDGIAWPILRDRTRWVRNRLYDKLVLSDRRIRYAWSYKRAMKRKTPATDPDLRLIHLKMLDTEACLQRNIKVASLPSGKVHYRQTITDPEALEAQVWEHLRASEPIPERFKVI